ncbi:FadR/GntR family transcriptional regulator [Gordonia sinesedis]
MTEAEPIAPPRRTSELVVARMEELIRDGRWPVGDRIPAEPELVDQFGVGRNTIREAVRALEYSGMLVPRRGDGTYVRSRNALAAAMSRCASTELADLRSVRGALEAEAAATAALRASPDVVAGLREELRTAEAAFATGDADRYANADIALHTAVVAASGNPLLIEIYDGVVEAMYRTHVILARVTLTAAQAPAGHRDMVDAIERGDPAAARAAVYDYLDDPAHQPHDVKDTR